MMKKTVLSTIPMDQRLQEPVIQRTQAFKVAHNLLASFRYAWAGVSYAFITQRNFRIHTIIGSIALGLGLSLGLPPVELAVVGITSGLVLVMELLNTALEAVVDLTVSQTYHELAKIAKDCAAASVLISALVAVIVAGLLLFPPLLVVLSAMMS
ncbi:MAG: diacylglycerol kinase family protein [Thermosynechococcaceae cyanobacterium]